MGLSDPKATRNMCRLVAGYDHATTCTPRMGLGTTWYGSPYFHCGLGDCCVDVGVDVGHDALTGRMAVCAGWCNSCGYLDQSCKVPDLDQTLSGRRQPDCDPNHRPDDLALLRCPIRAPYAQRPPVNGGRFGLSRSFPAMGRNPHIPMLRLMGLSEGKGTWGQTLRPSSDNGDSEEGRAKGPPLIIAETTPNAGDG